MTERIASDHPSVETIRARVCRHAGRRLRIDLVEDPDGIDPADGPIDAVVDDQTRVVTIATVGQSIALTGVYRTMASARAGQQSANELRDVLASMDRTAGDAVLIDVIDPGERIGIRRPGDRVRYDARGGTDTSLDAIVDDVFESP